MQDHDLNVFVAHSDAVSALLHEQSETAGLVVRDGHHNAGEGATSDADSDDPSIFSPSGRCMMEN
jgi:hypothetical protein